MHAITDPANIAAWLATWGYLGIFISVFIGNLGIPVPEETVMIAAGFLANRNILDLRYVYVVVILSAVTGDCCGFIIGRTGGQRLLVRHASKSQFFRTRFERLKPFFQTYRSKEAVIARFIPGACILAETEPGGAEVHEVT